MRVMFPYFLVALLSCVLTLAAHGVEAIECPSGDIDVLDWLTLDEDLRSTSHMTGTHPLYTVVWGDKYFWLKTPSGDTWDINLFDSSMIYAWITENEHWETPFDYKKATYNNNLPMAHRCSSPGYPGTQIFISNSSYTPAENCIEQAPRDLGNVKYEIWGPYTAGQPGLETSRPPIGGDITDSTMVYTLAYLYNCDGNYANCQDKEEYILTQRYGLVRWNLWKWQNSQWELNNRSTFNQMAVGTTAPFFPCF